MHLLSFSVAQALVAPFPYSDAMAFAPNFAKTPGATEEAKPVMPDMVRWLAAYEDFSVASAAAGMWSYAATRAHLKKCLQVRSLAQQPGIVSSKSASLAPR